MQSPRYARRSFIRHRDGRLTIILGHNVPCQKAAPDTFLEDILSLPGRHFHPQVDPVPISISGRCVIPQTNQGFFEKVACMSPPTSKCHSVCFQYVTPYASNMSLHMLLTCHSLSFQQLWSSWRLPTCRLFCFQHVIPYASNMPLLKLSTGLVNLEAADMSLLMLPACHSLCFQHLPPYASNMSLLMLSTFTSLCFQHVTPYASNMSLLTRPTCHCCNAINRWMTGRFVSSFFTSKMTYFYSIPFQHIFLFKLVLSS
jgi:hypothetical protein